MQKKKPRRLRESKVKNGKLNKRKSNMEIYTSSTLDSRAELVSERGNRELEGINKIVQRLDQDSQVD